METPAKGRGKVGNRNSLAFIDPAELRMRGRVGGGAVGVVHKAEWRGSEVAVKRMGESYLLIADTQAEILQEAQIWCNLRHPNVLLFLGYTWFPRPEEPAPGLEQRRWEGRRRRVLDKYRVNP